MADQTTPKPAAKTTLESMMEPMDDAPEDIENDSERGSLHFSDSLDDFMDADVAYPRLRIAQPQTPEVTQQLAKPGDYLLEGFKPQKTLMFVPLKRAKSRLYATGQGTERKIRCESTNAIIGHGDPGGPCDSCPMAEWSTSAEGNRVPPPCSERVSFVGYVPEFKAVCMMSFQKTSAKAGRLLGQIIQGRGYGNFAIQLRAELEHGKRNGTSYQVPKYTVVEDEELPVGLLETANVRGGRTKPAQALNAAPTPALEA